MVAPIVGNIYAWQGHVHFLRFCFPSSHVSFLGVAKTLSYPAFFAAKRRSDYRFGHTQIG